MSGNDSVARAQSLSPPAGHGDLSDARRIAELEAALREIVDAAEALTRPGSQGRQHVNVARMTTAMQAGAKLIDHPGILPELEADRG